MAGFRSAFSTSSIHFVSPSEMVTKVGYTKLQWAYRLQEHTLNTSKLQYNGRAMERHC